jgi:formylglycine-generating enzyme required for sulfatase activity
MNHPKLSRHLPLLCLTLLLGYGMQAHPKTVEEREAETIAQAKADADKAAIKKKAEATRKANAARFAELQQKCEKKGGDWKKGKCVMPPPPPAPAPKKPDPTPKPVIVEEPAPVDEQPPEPAPVVSASHAMTPQMVNIPGGTFTMGCVDSRDNVEGGCYDSEKPAHEVSVSAFQMAKTETTVGQYMACVDAGVCSQPEWQEANAPDYYKSLGAGLSGSNYPVVGVSWNDANAYAKWLSKKTGDFYRLPTEAEWEYAARGGTDTAYPWGNAIGKGNANCYGDGCGDKFDYTAPVGSFAANGYGLNDMNGNVWEWVQDNWHSDYKGAPADGSAWESGGDASRVLRGGSWYNLAQYVRSADRNYYTPGLRDGYDGFRLASGQ